MRPYLNRIPQIESSERLYKPCDLPVKSFEQNTHSVKSASPFTTYLTSYFLTTRNINVIIKKRLSVGV